MSLPTTRVGDLENTILFSRTQKVPGANNKATECSFMDVCAPVKRRRDEIVSMRAMQTRQRMGATKVQARRRGRPQGDEVKVAILKAANELLEDQGFSGFTIEAVAARAGAARSTIYRWWPNRGALAMAGFLSETAPKIAYRWTTSPISDIKQQMMLVAEVYGGKVGRTISAIVAQGQRDPETLKALLDGYVRPRREEAKRVLMRGIECGELRKDIDLDIVVDSLYGPIWYRLLVPHAPISVKWAAKLADQVFRGLRAK